LSEVEALQRVGRLPLNAQEASYVAACIANREREESEKRERLVADQKTASQRRVSLILRWATAFLTLLLLIAVAMAIFALDQRQEAQEQGRLAQVERQIAQQQAVVSQAGEIAGASINVASGGQEDQLAALLAVESSTIGAKAGVDGEVGSALQASIGAPYFSWLIDAGNQAPVTSTNFEPNGSHLAAGHFNGTVMLWDLASTPPARQALTPAFSGSDVWVSSVVFSPDGRYLAASAYNGAIQIWDRSSGTPVLVSSSLQLPRAVYSLAFGTSPEKGLFLLAAGCAEQTCASNSIGDPAAVDAQGSVGRIIFKRWFADSNFNDSSATSFELSGNRVYSTAISGNGRWLAAAGCKLFSRRPTPEPHRGNACAAGFLYILELDNEDAPLLSLDAGEGAIMAVTFAPGSDEQPLLAAGGDDRLIRLWQPGYRESDPALVTTLTGHNEEIRSLAFSPTDPILVSGGHDGDVSLWDISSPYPVVQVLGNSAGWIRTVAFDSTGRHMVSAHGNGQVRLWEIVPEHPLSEPGILPGHASYIRAIAFSPNRDEPMLVSAAEDGTIRIWHVENGQAVVRTVPIRQDSPGLKVSSLSFNADGSSLAIADERGGVWKIDPRDPSSTLIRIGSLPGGTLLVAFNPSHPIVAAGGSSGRVLFWDATASEPVPIGVSLDAGGAQIWSIAFSRDGTLLAVGTTGGSVYRWRMADGGRSAESLPTLTLDGVDVRSLTFGPENELVTGSSDGSICFWGSGEPAAPNSCPLRIEAHTGDVRSLVFSPKGDLLASGGIDQVLRIWNPQRPNAAPIVIPTIMEWVRGLAFSPDGRTLAASSTQGSIRLILPYSEDLIVRACSRVGREMTSAEWSIYMKDEQQRATCPTEAAGGDQGGSPPAIAMVPTVAVLPEQPIRARAGLRRRRYTVSHPRRRSALLAA
jgi:WD40 repeat protein